MVIDNADRSPRAYSSPTVAREGGGAPPRFAIGNVVKVPKAIDDSQHVGCADSSKLTDARAPGSQREMDPSGSRRALRH